MDMYIDKIISPCMCEIPLRKKPARAFVRIEYKDGKLSMVGSIGPTYNGGCYAGGQCHEEIREGKPTDLWDEEMLQKLCDIWQKWHLNDLRPYCEHQKQLGWDKVAKQEVFIYHYTLTKDAIYKQYKAEQAAKEALKQGITWTPSEEQIMYANLKYSIATPEPLSGPLEPFYEPQKALWPGAAGAVEVNTLGWLNTEEHPEGLVGRPCPVCGYEYGTDWKTEPVPEDVIEWLFYLPEASVKHPYWAA